MKNTLTYIFRKPDPNYKSIEGLFTVIANQLEAYADTELQYMNYAGGGLKTIWSNLTNFQKQESHMYHITGDVHYMALRTGKQSVLTIHDVQSILKSPLLKRLYFKLVWFWLPALFVSRITVISEFTKKELSAVIPFSKNKIRVVYNPVNPKFQYCQTKFNASKPRLLLIGTKANKNLERTLLAIQNMSCEVVIIGKLFENQLTLLSELNISYVNKFDLTFDELHQCYNECDILCFASTYEGFGMPIIEAQAVGKPVLTSNIGAMLEVAADSTCLVNPYEVSSIRLGITKLINDDQYRENLILKGLENIKRFEVSKIAQDYLEVYKEINNK